MQAVILPIAVAIRTSRVAIVVLTIVGSPQVALRRQDRQERIPAMLPVFMPIIVAIGTSRVGIVVDLLTDGRCDQNEQSSNCCRLAYRLSLRSDRAE